MSTKNGKATKADTNLPQEPVTEVAITEDDAAQEAAVDVEPAKPKPKAKRTKKSAQAARRRQQDGPGATTKATRTKKAGTAKKPAKGAPKSNTTALKAITFAQLPTRFAEHLRRSGRASGR